MVKGKDMDTLVALGGLTLGYFFLFTDEGKKMLDEIVGKIPGIDFLRGYSQSDIEELSRKESDKYFPPQHLYVPPNYYKQKFFKEDPYRKASPEWKDWYAKGSGWKLEDYQIPKHYNWNPDYYFFFGNMYKKWYPSAYEPNRWAGDRGYEPIKQTAWDFPLFP